MRELKGARVLLTGGSDGIGRALALALGAEGARVALVARREDKLREVAEQVRAAGGEAIVCPADVTAEGEVDVAVDALRAMWDGGPDLVIANAGIGYMSKVERADWGKVLEVIDVNVGGAIRTIGAALPSMLEQGSGHVVGVASPAGFRGLPRSGAYSASKAALTRFLESLRVEVQPKGIEVTTVHPGFVRTPLTDTNKTPMPFIIEADVAAQHILKAIKKGRREVMFPWQMAMVMHTLRRLPNALFDRIARKMM